MGKVAAAGRQAVVLPLLHTPHEMVKEDVLGIHRGIGFEGIIPIPIGVLLALEVMLSAVNRTLNTLEKFTRC